MKTIGIAVLLAAMTGCASTTTTEGAARASFPQRIAGSTEIPAMSRYDHLIQARHAGKLAARVHLCVAPSGKVSHAELLQSSGFDKYDKALLAEIFGWSYAGFTAPGRTRVCQTVEIVYWAS